MKKYIIIKWIPGTTSKTRNFLLPVRRWKMIKVAAVIFVIIVIGIGVEAFIVGDRLVNLHKLERENKALLETQQKYEEYFATLDSIFEMDFKIKNIMDVFMEENPEKIQAILNKNPKVATNKKNEIDFENRWGSWQSPEEKQKLERMPNIIPVSGIISKKYSDESKHFAVDLSAKPGDPVFASAEGIVTAVETTQDLGLHITIDHQNGYTTSYSHMSASRIKVGHKVRKGEVIGSVGSSGKASGPHLHYEVRRNGNPINPEDLFNN